MAMLQLRVITAYFIRYFDFELIEEPGKEFFLTLKPTSMMMKVRKAY
jgi:cytochrome P450